MFEGYEDLDLYESMVRDYDSLLSLFILRIDDLKKIFSEHQIRILRQLIRADKANANHDLELVRQALQESYKQELLSSVIQ